MDITESTIYWWTRLDDVRNGLMACGSFVLAGIIVATIGLGITRCDVEDTLWPRRYWLYMVPLTFLCVALMLSTVFIPSERDYALIKVVPAIANNEAIAAEASEFYDMAKEALRQQLRPGNSE